MAVSVDLGNEVFIAGKDYDQDQITGQGQIDQRQRHQDRAFGSQIRNAGYLGDQLADKHGKQSR